MANHKHEVRTCAEFFALSPLDHWENRDKGRMCFSCLKPKTICKSRKCTNYTNVPEVLKCAVCDSWALSKGLALFSIFFCKQKEHGEFYSSVGWGEEGTGEVYWKTGNHNCGFKYPICCKFYVPYLRYKRKFREFSGIELWNKTFPPAPTIDSKTGLLVLCQEENVFSESSESSIYLMQNLRIGNSDCLTFFNSVANAHLINGKLTEKEK